MGKGEGGSRCSRMRGKGNMMGEEGKEHGEMRRKGKSGSGGGSVEGGGVDFFSFHVLMRVCSRSKTTKSSHQFR